MTTPNVPCRDCGQREATIVDRANAVYCQPCWNARPGHHYTKKPVSSLTARYLARHSTPPYSSANPYARYLRSES